MNALRISSLIIGQALVIVSIHMAASGRSEKVIGITSGAAVTLVLGAGFGL